MNKKLLNICITALFCTAIFAAPVLFFLLPKDSFSQREKRVLTPLPALNAETLASGIFTERLGSFVADHFPGRTFFVGLNAYYDLCAGRQDSKDYFLARGGRLFARPVETDYDALDRGLDTVNSFCRDLAAAGYDVPVSLMLVPSSGAVLLDSPQYPDAALIDYVYERAETGHVELLPLFRTAADPGALYYRTDHHWTSEGAFLAACAYRQALGLPCPSREDYRRESHAPFYGSAYSASGLWLTQPDSLELWYSDSELRVTNESGGVNGGVLYPERLNELDRYTVFLDGNHSLVRIENLSAPGGGRLLVIRDSFSNSLGCFLADLYDEVVLVDLRYYKLSLSELLADGRFSKILIEYSVDNFLHDQDLGFLYLDAAPAQVEEPQKAPNYFAPPDAIREEMFDGAYYLGDSVTWTLIKYCTDNGKLSNATVASNSRLKYEDIVTMHPERLIYKGRYTTLPELLRRSQAPVLIAALGVNDLPNYDVDYCTETVVKFLELARETDPALTVFIQSVMPVQTRMPGFSQDKIDAFNAWLKDNAETCGYCYIELDKYFKDENGELSQSYKYDNTHINEAGGAVWYRELMNIDNYYNFPEKFWIEYDGETHLPVESAQAAPAAPQETAPPMPREWTLLDELYEKLCAGVELPEMTELTGRAVEQLGFREGDYADARFYLCSNGLKADELWLLEAADEASAGALLESARERLEVKARSFENYLPAEYEIARRGLAVRQGRYVALLISPDAEKLREIFLSALA